ncbi:hypothetical protein L5515_015417 [Caenorhabditis briggsae]|uniref:Uncharacterized protein n=1 Tax=Caenorhabditis briggsae TaxID=6238 RepID=A0AAE9JA45_CAEBR|nr:hypothetical protein L5515_015417 [Caenorhabditis briggsae]
MYSISKEPSSSSNSDAEIQRLKQIIETKNAKIKEMRTQIQDFGMHLIDEKIKIAVECGAENGVHNYLVNEVTVNCRTITALRRHNDALAQRVEGFEKMFEEQDAQFANLKKQVETVCEENAALRKELDELKESQAADPTTVSKKD